MLLTRLRLVHEIHYRLPSTRLSSARQLNHCFRFIKHNNVFLHQLQCHSFSTDNVVMPHDLHYDLMSTTFRFSVTSPFGPHQTTPTSFINHTIKYHQLHHQLLSTTQVDDHQHHRPPSPTPSYLTKHNSHPSFHRPATNSPPPRICNFTLH